jgi:hypothetical protein
MRFEDDTNTPLLEPFPTGHDATQGSPVDFQTGYLDGSKSAQFLARRRELACYPPTADCGPNQGDSVCSQRLHDALNRTVNDGRVVIDMTRKPGALARQAAGGRTHVHG